MRHSLRTPLAALVFMSGCVFYLAARGSNPSYALFTDAESMRLRFEAGSWGCVHSQGYWKNHADAWPTDQLEVGGASVDKDLALEILHTSPKGDATIILAHQLIAAKLNLISGATQVESVSEAIAQADAWMGANPIGSDPSDEPRSEGIELADLLEAYNSGKAGATSCDDEPPSNDKDPCDEEGFDGGDAGTGNDEGDLTNHRRPDECSDDEETGIAPEDEGIHEQARDPEVKDLQTPTDEATCEVAQTFEYWLAHSDSWPVESIEVGGFPYSAADAVALDNLGPQEDTSYQLLRQMIAAKLNMLLATVDGDVPESVRSADEWVAEHLVGGTTDEIADELGLALVDELQAYNLSQIDTTDCDQAEDDPSSSGDASTENTTHQADDEIETSGSEAEG